MARLRVKQINTVGFVDKGDDPEAVIALWKRVPEPAMDRRGPTMGRYLKRLGTSPDEAQKLLGGT